MAPRHPIVRGLVILCVVLVCFFAVSVLLTVATSGRLDSLTSFGERVGVVDVRGVIADSEDIVEALKDFERASSVRAVVVRIESPGGGVAPSQEIYHAIRKLRETKPVLASLGGVAASGGYYIASACDAIVANPGTITGSIGVIMELGNVEGLLQKLGIQPEVLKAGAYKDMGSPVRPLRPEERRLFQEMIDSVHEQFVGAVAEGRGMDLRKVRELADGRIFSGEQAHAVGLVDALGGLQNAINMAADRAGIVGEPRVNRAGPSRVPWWWHILFDMAPAGFLPTRPALGLQLVYGGSLLR